MKNFSNQVYLLFIAILLMPQAVYAEQSSENNFLCIEGDALCTFVLLSESSNALLNVNQLRATTALSPFSIFKITNSVIALEQGLIKNTKQILTYDKVKYPTQAWWPPVWKLPEYQLTNAFKYSMVLLQLT